MINLTTLLTILAMAAVTYLTRILGFVALRNRTLSKRAMSVMQVAPGCVLIAVISPHFASNQPSELIALGITVLVATRFSMLPTVIIGVASAGILNYIMA